MKPIYLTLAVGTVVAGLVALGAVAPAIAQKGQAGATPNNWSYEVKNGRRVPRGHRVANPDGSWREEVRDGACVTTRTMSAAGEYRETRACT